MKPKIVIFTNSDIPWDLPLWYFTIKKLKKKYKISSIYVFPDKIKNLKNYEVPLWYAKNFGIINFIKLSLFAIVRYLVFVLKYKTLNFKHLAKKFDLDYFEFSSPNSEKTIKTLKKEKPDILLILLTHILKKDILSIPKIATINQHGGILPAAKGVMPYFYSILYDLPVGITCYKVTEKINEGPEYLRIFLKKKKSMVEFYRTTFRLYPKMIDISVKKALKRKFLKKLKLKKNYFSYPTPELFRKFRKKHEIITFKDILFPF